MGGEAFKGSTGPVEKKIPIPKGTGIDCKICKGTRTVKYPGSETLYDCNYCVEPMPPGETS